MSPFQRLPERMKLAMACVSSGISAGTLTGSSDPLMRSAGGAPALRWMSEAPFFTAAARSWLKVRCSISVPRLGQLRVRLAQAIGKRRAEAAVDLDCQLVVGGQKLFEFAPRKDDQLHLALRQHLGRGEVVVDQSHLAEQLALRKRRQLLLHAGEGVAPAHRGHAFLEDVERLP